MWSCSRPTSPSTSARYFSLDYFKSQQAAIDTWYQAHPWQTALIYFLVYVAVTGLSLPGAALLTLAGGAIFGLLWGTLIVSFASSIGATLAFLASRFLFRDAIQRRFGDKLRTVNAGVEKEGAFYLFTLRLVPAFPFFLINLVMGLTPMKTWTFYWVSQIGMLLGTIVYVNAGTQLARIDSLRGILSLELIISFALLGVFPLAAKKIVDLVKVATSLRALAEATQVRPQPGGDRGWLCGPGRGVYRCHRQGQSHTHREAPMGGDCLNTGCVPSKALIRSAKLLADIRRSQQLGHPLGERRFRFRGRHGASAAGDTDGRAARFRRTLHRFGRRMRPRRSADHFAVVGRDYDRSRAAAR